MSNNNPTKTKACRLSSLIFGHHHQGNLIKQPTSHGYSTTRSSTRTNRSTHSFHRTSSLKLMKRSRNQRSHFKTLQRDSHCAVQSSPYSTRIRQSPLYIDFELATVSKPRQTSLVTLQSTSNPTFKNMSSRQHRPHLQNDKTTQPTQTHHQCNPQNSCKSKLLQKRRRQLQTAATYHGLITHDKKAPALSSRPLSPILQHLIIRSLKPDV